MKELANLILIAILSGLLLSLYAVLWIAGGKAIVFEDSPVIRGIETGGIALISLYAIWQIVELILNERRRS